MGINEDETRRLDKFCNVDEFIMFYIMRSEMGTLWLFCFMARDANCEDDGQRSLGGR